MFDVKPAQPKYEPRFRDSELYVKDKSGVLNENKKYIAPEKRDMYKYNEDIKNSFCDYSFSSSETNIF